MSLYFLLKYRCVLNLLLKLNDLLGQKYDPLFELTIITLHLLVSLLLCRQQVHISLEHVHLLGDVALKHLTLRKLALQFVDPLHVLVFYLLVKCDLGEKPRYFDFTFLALFLGLGQG